MTVPRQMAQRGIETLREMGLIDKSHQLKKLERKITIPIIREPSSAETQLLRTKLGNFVISETNFESIVSRPKRIQDAIQTSSTLASKLPRSFDLIGDIAIVEIPSDLDAHSSEIGKAILQLSPHVRLVLRKCSDVMGTFRTRKFQVIAGTGTTETVHHEFSCQYNLDVAEVYFNPRLSNERMRVARQVKPNETVVDMFAGVGPYSVLTAKSQPTSKVFSIDINPTAIKYLRQNTFVNRVADHVIPMHGDSRKLSVNEVQGIADRVIMNLPSEAENYIDAAIRTLKKRGGRIHFYQFVDRESRLDSLQNSFKAIVEAQDRKVEAFEFCNVIREISPGIVQVAIDALVN
ncbi:MAG TPA: class I SAM-dependent methyltransferase family protein [Candidatus Acidoferrales bacterium]|nr:class I SAM-dependent methyltransferase family protein [Candidatus Acidoferrales bacterium]